MSLVNSMFRSNRTFCFSHNQTTYSVAFFVTAWLIIVEGSGSTENSGTVELSRCLGTKFRIYIVNVYIYIFFFQECLLAEHMMVRFTSEHLEDSLSNLGREVRLTDVAVWLTGPVTLYCTRCMVNLSAMTAITLWSTLLWIC